MQALVLRGPAGVGKSAVAKRLAHELKAHVYSYDTILEEHDLDTVVDGAIPEEHFLKANAILLKKIQFPAILDGCFYYERQIADLKKHISAVVVTLTAPLEVCIERDRLRSKPLGPNAVAAVYRLVRPIQGEMRIENRNVEETVREILEFLERGKVTLLY